MFKFNFIANDDESKLAKSAMSDSDLQPDDDNSKSKRYIKFIKLKT